MPLYFFHVRNDVDCTDEEGQELPDLEAARRIALDSARLLICESIRKGAVTLDHFIEVTGEDGAQLFTQTYRDAFEIRAGQPAAVPQDR